MAKAQDARRGPLTPASVGPFTRPVDVTNIPPQGAYARVEATEEERRALARDFGLAAVHALSGEYRLTSSAKGVHVAGHIEARIAQTCVVTLEPFDSLVAEEVEVDFAESSGMPAEPPTELHEYEPPDEIVNGTVDLGALTAEFLVLGLDPYPRKPGASFEYEGDGERDSPFAGLGKLKRK